MDEQHYRLLWEASNEKWNSKSLIDKKMMDEITRMKIHGYLDSMKPVKIFALTVGILWVAICGAGLVHLFTNHYSEVSLFFLYSAAGQVLITAVGVGIYIYQIIQLYEMDYSQPVLSIQKRLLNLKLSALQATKILFLQLPLWTTFYLSKDMVIHGSIWLWIVQGVATILFTLLAGWLFFNINERNIDKRWFRFIFSGREWQPVIKSMELMKQMEYSY